MILAQNRILLGERQGSIDLFHRGMTEVTLRTLCTTLGGDGFRIGAFPAKYSQNSQNIAFVVCDIQS
jgi:hypothetical protein